MSIEYTIKKKLKKKKYLFIYIYYINKKFFFMCNSQFQAFQSKIDNSQIWKNIYFLV